MALWTPDLISPHTWIDFSDTSTLFDATTGGSVVTNGVGIARAEDKSGNGRNFTQSTSGSRPTFTSNVQNGLGIARFDGGDYLNSVSANSIWTFLHNSKSSVFFVLKNGTSVNPLAAYGWLGNTGTSSGRAGIFIAYDDRALLTGLEDALNAAILRAVGGSYVAAANDGAQVFTDFRNIITPNAFNLALWKGDPGNATAADRMKIAINGGAIVGNQTYTAAFTNSNPTLALQIGSAGNNILPLLGDYCELLIFNSLLSTTDQQLVEGYLAWKWGTESLLPNTHPYYSAAPTVGRARRLINDGLFNRGLFNTGLMR